METRVHSLDHSITLENNLKKNKLSKLRLRDSIHLVGLTPVRLKRKMMCMETQLIKNKCTQCKIKDVVPYAV